MSAASPERDTEYLDRLRDHSIIRPKGQLEIFGVMVGLVRRFAN